MPKPFPYPLNVGTDICSISRILSLISRHDGQQGPKFMHRILNQSERTQLDNRLRIPMAIYVRAVRINAIAEWKATRLTVRERATAAKQLRDRFFSNKPPPAWSTAALAAFRNLGPAEISQQQEEILRAELDALRDWKLEKTFALVPSPWDALLEDLKSGKSVRDAFDEARSAIKAEGDILANRKQENAGTQLEKDMQTWIQEGIWKEENHAKESESDESLAVQGKDSSESKELQQLNLQTRGQLQAAKAQLKTVAELLAGRFAAKEAVIKAHPSTRLMYHNIMIYQPPKSARGTQAPVAIIIPESGDMAEAQEAKISISHDEGFATAVCLAVEPEPASGKILIPRRVTASSSTTVK